MPDSGAPLHRLAAPKPFRASEGEMPLGKSGDGLPRMITAGVGTAGTVLSWPGHTYRSQSGKPARFAAVLDHEMVDFLQDSESEVLPPPDEIVGRSVAALEWKEAERQTSEPARPHRG